MNDFELIFEKIKNIEIKIGKKIGFFYIILYIFLEKELLLLSEFECINRIFVKWEVVFFVKDVLFLMSDIE